MATDLETAGVDVRVIQTVLGHVPGNVLVLTACTVKHPKLKKQKRAVEWVLVRVCLNDGSGPADSRNWGSAVRGAHGW